MKHRMLLRVSVTLGLLAGAVGYSLPAQSASNRPPWIDAAGKVAPDKMPARVKIGTDLFATGYGWLDSTALRNPSQEGPYMIYESEASDVPAYWYYHGTGIVSIGASAQAASRGVQTQNTVSTAAP
jgi:hypothetical protein